MKTWHKCVLITSLLTLVFALLALTRPNPAHVQIFPATVNRDCAPWDGSAFTVSIPYDEGNTITISIWKLPDYKFPVTFSFPGGTSQVGIAYIQREFDPLEQLAGKVTFQRVQEGMPLEGVFRFTSARGEVFAGRLIAEWGNQVIYCG